MIKKYNYYKELGVDFKASKSEIKSAYRSLAKKYHPDKGGDKEKFLIIQNAWETLNDPVKRQSYDSQFYPIDKSQNSENTEWKENLKNNTYSSSKTDKDIEEWIKNIYMPINKSLNQIIKPLNNEIKELSADPYDDLLMEQFCNYINKSRKKIDKVTRLYKTYDIPKSLSNLGLDLYHCFSQVQDALEELDRYTHGYVDDYLFDGKEMMKEAKRIQTKMTAHKKTISFS